MLSTRSLPSLAILFCVNALVCILINPAMAQDNVGEDINIHNNTGHEVYVFLFQDARVHLDDSGGVQVSFLRNGESAVAHVPKCEFSVLLVDNIDLWHAEFHDCNTTDLLFTPTTGHSKRGEN